MKKLKNFWKKIQVLYTVYTQSFKNLWQVSRVILSQDLDAIKKQREEEQAKQIEAEMDALSQAPPELEPHKMVGSQDPRLPPRPVKSGELDPKNFIIEIPEEKIRQAHITTGGINNFTRLLYTAEIFREAGMTPMFLTNKQESIIRVAATETWNKPNILN